MRRKKTIYELCFKRVFDIFASLFAILISWPLMVLVALLIRFKLGKPIMFNQTRPGKNEKLFVIYKFRTMTNELDEKGLLLEDEVRMTKLGQFIRSTSLDELPQLFNILKGEMSFVGPRPVLTEYIEVFTKEERKRHSVKPGLMSLASVRGRNSLSWDEKNNFDLEYISKITFLNDIKILLKAVYVVLSRKDVTSEGHVTSEKFIRENKRNVE